LRLCWRVSRPSVGNWNNTCQATAGTSCRSAARAGKAIAETARTALAWHLLLIVAFGEIANWNAVGFGPAMDHRYVRLADLVECRRRGDRKATSCGGVAAERSAERSGAVARERLLAQVWCDADLSLPVQSLHSLVHTLHRMLADAKTGRDSRRAARRRPSTCPAGWQGRRASRVSRPTAIAHPTLGISRDLTPVAAWPHRNRPSLA
jgi:hypothetical protein